MKSNANSIEPRTYIGGLLWRRWSRASWPLAKLTIEPNGLTIAPTLSRFPTVWGFLGIPTLSVDWRSIDNVELVRSLFSLGHVAGVFFRINGQRLVFGCGQSAAEDIVEYVTYCVPEKVVQRAKPRLII